MARSPCVQQPLPQAPEGRERATSCSTRRPLQTPWLAPPSRQQCSGTPQLGQPMPAGQGGGRQDPPIASSRCLPCKAARQCFDSGAASARTAAEATRVGFPQGVRLQCRARALEHTAAGRPWQRNSEGATAEDLELYLANGAPEHATPKEGRPWKFKVSLTPLAPDSFPVHWTCLCKAGTDESPTDESAEGVLGEAQGAYCLNQAAGESCLAPFARDDASSIFSWMDFSYCTLTRRFARSSFSFSTILCVSLDVIDIVVCEVMLGETCFGDVVAGQPVTKMGGQTYHSGHVVARSGTLFLTMASTSKVGCLDCVNTTYNSMFFQDKMSCHCVCVCRVLMYMGQYGASLSCLSRSACVALL